MPAPRDRTSLEAEGIQVPEPLPQSEPIKPPIIQRIMPLVMIGMVGGMLALMFTSGGAMSPMMLMMPMMLVMGMMSMFTGGANEVGELNAERKNYALQLREERKVAHRQGKALHHLQTMTFPGPTILHNFIGQEDPALPIMWQTTEVNPGGLLVEEGTVDEVSFSPWMSARIGKGTTNLLPALTFEELQVAENLEPVTTSQFRAFVRTQGFVTNMPVAVNMASSPAFALTGDVDKVFGLARAMIMSMAFNHAPSSLRIAVVSDDIESETWSWLKWLPHAQHPSAEDRFGTARLLYTSLTDFTSACPDAVSPPQENHPRWLVIVDKPNHEIRPPVSRGFEAGRIASTFLVVRAGADHLASSKRSRYEVDEDGVLHMPGDVKLAADYASLEVVDVFARSMACWKSIDTSDISLTGSASTERFRKQTWFEILGIGDIEAWDPRTVWEHNEQSSNFETPLGYARRGAELVEGIVTLDFAEASRGGSGPHGVGQGKTGTGKSFMLGGIVLSMAALFSPHKVNFILMDFKGGSTFMGFELLPHTVAVISNLASETELLDRAEDVIDGELTRRQEELKKYKVKDILEYRKKRHSHPELDMPAMPDLFIIADEFREFIKDNRHYLKLFESVAAIGRSLGVHLFLVSQYIDTSLIASVDKQLTYGISLAVESESESRAVLGSSGKAAHLSGGNGDALVSYKSGTNNGTIAEFRTFNIEQTYVPPAPETSLESTVISDAAAQKSDTVLEVFTARNQTRQAEAEVIDHSDSPAAPAPEVVDSAETQMKNVLIDRISRFTDMKGLSLWQESLQVPLTYSKIQPKKADPSSWDLRIVIGETDEPKRHRRVPFVISPSNPSTGHINIVGRPATGKSTTVETIISSTALSYGPDKVQFLVIDYAGAKLREVEEYPHVIGYSSGSNTDLIDRFFGEVRRVVDLRREAMNLRESPTVAAYLASKAADPVEGDPYGRLFLVIDGLGQMIAEEKEGRDPEFDKRLLSLMKTALQVGVHVIATTAGGDVGFHISQSKIFGQIIPLSMDNAVEVVDDRELRARVVNIPTGQPGRSVDMNLGGLYSRILIPVTDEVEPIGYDDGNPIYARDTDFGPQIRQLAAYIRTQYEPVKDTWVPQVHAAPTEIDYTQVWERYRTTIDPEARTAAQPFALETSDLSIVDLADSPSPHLIVFGDPSSGKTTALRTIINNVVQQRRPHEAQFLFFDPSYAFFAEQQVLTQNNMCLAYTTSPDEAGDMFSNLAATLESRIPNAETMRGVSRDTITNRRWYDGPDFYVIIDNLAQLGSGFGGGVADPLGEVLAKNNSLGCFVFAAASPGDSTQLLTTKSLKLPDALMSHNAPILLLSGSNTQGKVVGNERFELRRPGQGRFYDPSRNPTGRTVQVVNTQPWPEPAAQ